MSESVSVFHEGVNLCHESVKFMCKFMSEGISLFHEGVNVCHEGVNLCDEGMS